MHKNTIFVFTNNNSIKLSKILSELDSVKNEFNIYVVDDSHKNKIIKSNFNLTLKIAKDAYLGRDAFKAFYNLNYSYSEDQVIGTDKWNLGIARNFALDYAKRKSLNKILFVDDDITKIDHFTLNKGFASLNGENFVSCHLKGLYDESIVANIARTSGLEDKKERLLSGGFLFLSSLSIKNKFYNIYNEDWILQLLENDKERVLIDFSVTHDENGSREWKIENVYFQEVGEIIIKALLSDNHAMNWNNKKWEAIIEERYNYLTNLLKRVVILKDLKAQKILHLLLEWHQEINSDSIIKEIQENERYFIKY